MRQEVKLETKSCRGGEMKKVLSLLLLLALTFPGMAGNNSHRTGLLFQDPRLDPHAKQIQSIRELKSFHLKSLPESWDNSAYLPPVDSQGGQGSCVAWAVGYYMRAEMENFAVGRTNPEEKALDCNRFSPAFLYDMIHSPGDNGAYYSDAFDILSTFGCCTWETMPYTDRNYTRWPAEAAFMEAMRYRTGAEDTTSDNYHSYYYYEDIKTEANLNDMKQLLSEGKTVIISIFVYTPYNSINATNDEYTLANGLAGVMGGGHAQCVVGYDDNHQTADGMGAFRVVNSWGTSWGDQGFYWISYDAVKFHDTNHDGQVTSRDEAICTGRMYWVDRKAYQPAKYLVKFDITHPAFRTLDIMLSSDIKSMTLFDLTTWTGFQRNYQSVTDGCMVVDVDDLFPQSGKTAGTLQLQIRDTKPGGTTGTVEDFQLIGPDGVTVSGETPYVIPESTSQYGSLSLSSGDAIKAVRNLPQVDSWQGNAMYLDLAVNGDSAYGIADGYLDVLDVSNSASPKRIGQYSGLGLCYGVDVSGNIVAVADYYYGLHLLDVSNPENVVLLGELPIAVAHPYKVDIDNGIAYVTLIGGGVAIVDIHDPANPVLIHKLTLSYSRDAKVKDGFLYVADGYNGLSVYDVSDPETPVKVGAYSPGGFTRAVALSGDRAVVGDSSAGLVLLDVSSPSNPTRLSSVALTGSTIYRVDMDQNRAFAAEGSHGIEIVDLSNPSALSKPATIQPQDFTRGVVLSGDTLYFADLGAGMGIEDVTNIGSPVELGRYKGIVPNRVFANGDTVLVTSLNDNEIRFAQISAGEIASRGALFPPESPSFASVGENGLSLLILGDDILAVVDTSDLNNPKVVGRVTFSGKHLQQAIVAGDMAYVSVKEDGIYTINLSDPAVPTETESIEMPGADCLALSSGFLAVSNANDQTIRILDIASPESLVQLSSVSVGSVFGLAIDNGYLFSNCGNDGVKAVDVSNPLQPGSAFTVSSRAIDAMALQNGFAYILDGHRQLYELDVRNPMTPIQTGFRSFTDLSAMTVTGSAIVASDPDTATLRLVPVAKSYSIPHVAESAWTTGITLFNENPYDVGIRLDKWGNGGTAELENGVYRVPANASLTLNNNDFGPDGTAMVMAGALQMKTKLSYRYGTSHSLCEFFVDPGAKADRYMLANTYRAWFDWFGLVVANSGSRTAHVTLSAWKDGILQGVRENIEILPHTKYVNLCQDIWDGLGYADIDMVTIGSDIPIAPPISITGNTAQDRHVFFTAQPLTDSAGETTLYMTHIPDGSWHTTLTLYNTTDTEKNATLTQWGDGGNTIISGQVYSVPAMGKQVLSTDAGDFQAQGLGKIIADGGIVAKLSYQYQDSHSFCEFFLDRNKTATKWMLTNSIQDFFQWFGVALSNPTDSTVTVTMKALKDGVVVGVTRFSLAPFSKNVGIASNFWEGMAYDGLDTVVIESDKPIPAPISITGNTAQDRHVFFNASSLN